MRSKILAGIFACLALGACEFLYPQTFVVTEIDYDEDVVYMETSTGMIFSFDEVEDFQVGDIVSAIMWNCGTPNITDDAIISYKYSGTVRDFERGSNGYYYEG